MAYKHITYMGAYSLKTWIRKIFKKEIELPDYQRDFEWSLDDAEDLKDSLEKGYYIPPITLAKYNDKIYLLDGQQRLTSIICLYLGVWPRNEIDIQEEDEERFSSKFTFKVLQNLKLDNVKNLLEKPDEFREIIFTKSNALEEKQKLKIHNINNIFFPYCLIVPNFNEDKKQRDFLAETFRRINTSGEALTDRELRRTTFWLYESIEKDIYTKGIKEFEEELKNIKTFQGNNDFLAYLAIICDFELREDSTMKGYNRIKRFDRYIVDFLLCCGKKEYNEIWTKDNIECIKNNQGRFEEGKVYFLDFFKNNQISEEKNISYQDIYLFSFTYYVYFTNKSINKESINNLLASAKNTMDKYFKKMDKEEKAKYDKQPNALKRIKDRIWSAFYVVCPEENNNE
ncbi:DUF262 domain-containing protein [Helicobacter sp.]|uniref:DUF262 domain-containing protein n=1 Tax=Helicobacter sp. TaxID=218 RepID=UPI00198BA69F|nr:DUF262 domain-containing protein [Helicobacter sp.]MBD5165806.1 DUF262 domain-containing protein [Helicobacter sp.]